MNDTNDKEKLIFSYTRRQAIEDGVLVDVSVTASEAGFTCPVAVTEGVFQILNPSSELAQVGQSLQGRLWDLLTILRWQIGKTPSWDDEVRFESLFLQHPDGKPEPIKMWAKVGPGDNMELVITVMLEGED